MKRLLLSLALAATTLIPAAEGDLLIYRYGASGVEQQVVTAGANSTVLQKTAAGTYILGTVTNSMLAGSIDLGKLATDPLSRANHTGTQLLATISDAGTLAGLSAVASSQITDGTIVNADINASAAIALSKLATNPLARANHTGTQLLATISDAGTLAGLSAVASSQITDGTIVNADINASAAIALSKLATDPLSRANHTGTQEWSTLTSTPTTLAGYSISDGVTTSALGSWTGTSNITTLGTVATGTWNATAISTSKGGAPASGTTGQVLTKSSNTSYDYAWATPSGGSGVDIQDFTADGTWTKPAGAKWCRIILIGRGGAGADGGDLGTGTGGGGGGPGSVVIQDINPDALAATEVVGIDESGHTVFAGHRAANGSAGSGATGGAAGAGGVAIQGMSAAAAQSGGGNNNADASDQTLVAPTGGGGGSFSTSDAGSAGGGLNVYWQAGYGGSAGGSFPAGFGAPGTTITGTLFGTGGGGGASGTDDYVYGGGIGGAGGNYGGGGGGGGEGPPFLGGNFGGAGGLPLCRVITWK